MNTIRIEKHRKSGGTDLSFYCMTIEQITNTQRLLKALEVIQDGDIVEEIRVHTGLELVSVGDGKKTREIGKGMIIEIRLLDETQPSLPITSPLRRWLDKLPGSKI